MLLLLVRNAPKLLFRAPKGSFPRAPSHLPKDQDSSSPRCSLSTCVPPQMKTEHVTPEMTAALQVVYDNVRPNGTRTRGSYAPLAQLKISFCEHILLRTRSKDFYFFCHHRRANFFAFSI